MATRIYLIRHGETLWNLEGRFQGQMDSPLSPLGERQAERLGQHFNNIDIHGCYSSDLGRAASTAQPIATATQQQLKTLKALRERSFGIFEGCLKHEAQALNPEAFEAWTQGTFGNVVPGGESRQTLVERVLASLVSLASQHNHETIAVISHGGVLSSLWRHLEPERQEQRGFSIPNASISQLSFDRGTWTVDSWSDVSHLEGLELSSPTEQVP